VPGGDGTKICASHLGAIDLHDYRDVLEGKSLDEHVLGTAMVSVEDIFDYGQGASTNGKEYLAASRNFQKYIAEVLNKIIEADDDNKDTIDVAKLPGVITEFSENALKIEEATMWLALAVCVTAAVIITSPFSAVASGSVIAAGAAHMLRLELLLRSDLTSPDKLIRLSITSAERCKGIFRNPSDFHKVGRLQNLMAPSMH